MYCIETQQLSHQFANDQVLKNVSLNVPQGSIYGFLGPNGAGKTTTLRLIVGLLKKQQGEVSVFGQAISSHRVEILRRMGNMIEMPSLYSHLTAKENLALLQKVYRCPKQRIEYVLQLVGLSDTGKKRAGKFSLGMKQRLGIAIAMLHNPDLLVLDEPTNGLDPNGMIEIRELLKKLNRENGTTIVISSHLLAEIEKLVTHAGIIHKGQMRFEGPLAQLMERQNKSSELVLETNDNPRALNILLASGAQAYIENGRIKTSFMQTPEIAEMNRALVQHGIGVSGITHTVNDLENIFMDITRN